ncbi:Protein BIG GRAIN 1-like C [Cardamine amara subsp. amara]|uniref:Protein BIG GRAIN 1-like C n=1 Tax=Cardamine amara subsp. amara TaxID=228776 RepID=A0ABD1AFE7_CARAN
MAFPQKKRTPSFSSSVLDSIYRSIDETDGFQSDLRGCKNSNSENVSSSSSSSSSPNKKDDKLTTLRRAIMDDEYSLYTRSSTTTIFSSSEGESNQTKRRSRKLAGQGNRSGEDRVFSKSNDDKNVKEVKILDEIKTSKQPVSPGARLTSFLNSIFQSNAKKVKLCSVGKTTDVKSSSSSRSCFSRTRYTTDDNNKNNNNCKNMERSIRFYPVRVTIGGDYVHKNITREKKPIQEYTEKKIAERVKSLKEEIKTKVHQTELTCITRKIGLKDFVRSYKYEGEEEEDDAWSYSSSDLFELDHNHHIGIGRFLKELPVYETTDFKTNQALARGLLL